ncbi:AraC family transcriptional regulator [Lentisphaera marina]|uniref:helix-turn-helix domain-containing protein n=1 Tax=Lentisphaera marina TaxID=1111041 RepID=UPI0023663758|nr:AraC family transcriptional regulator [Lentisphaera marina]MDD7987465.1 AraC family transcriptional regulator [Lentisphaera marina]
MKNYSTDINELRINQLVIVLEGEFMIISENENRKLSMGDVYLIKETQIECKELSASHKVLLINVDTEVSYLSESDELSLALIDEDFFAEKRSPQYLNASANYIIERLKKDSAHGAIDLPLIQQITDFINNNLDDKLSIDVLCLEFKVKKTQLIKLFKDNDLGSIMGYVKSLRFQKAKSLLENTEHSISQIATSCGFVDCASFSHFFKKHADKSPSQIRKERDWLM